MSDSCSWEFLWALKFGWFNSLFNSLFNSSRYLSYSLNCSSSLVLSSNLDAFKFGISLTSSPLCSYMSFKLSSNFSYSSNSSWSLTSSSALPWVAFRVGISLLYSSSSSLSILIYSSNLASSMSSLSFRLALRFGISFSFSGLTP